jgi:polynucleotide 5'-hydroxyl-kinase GRC3/NOL9
MSEDWANMIAEDFHRRVLLEKGTWLVLGGADTGKTTLVGALCEAFATDGPVGIVDGDVGQSHIGPPTTVGWGVVDGGRCDLSQVEARGIAFVGDITPAGHLLQFTGALLRCVEEASEAAQIVVIDTPGFIAGPAASALWWEVQRILRPQVIVAVRREGELGEILAGLKGARSHIELLCSPDTIRTKSPQERRRHRQRQFAEYLRESSVHEVSLNQVALQRGRRPGEQGRLGRVVGLRDENGQDVAVGVIERWGKGVATIKTPNLDIERIRCLVIGDVAVDFGEG